MSLLVSVVTVIVLGIVFATCDYFMNRKPWLR